jgi:hypothetical protein
LKKRNDICPTKQILSLLIFIGFNITTVNAQIDQKARIILNLHGEIIIRFKQPSSTTLQTLSGMMSIDNYNKQAEGNEITAYLNRNQFKQFEKSKIDYEIVTPPSLKAAFTMCPDIAGVKKWNCYPTYSQYIQIMQSFATDYPNLCKLVEFGQSVDGRKLLAVKISDNVNDTEEEPAFLYTSTMHGDEVTGYMLMLRLIDYLLSNYNSNSRITDLVNTTEIWINPLSNPDGTYSSGNSTLIGATRLNSNAIDLNRNYPDPIGNLHPDRSSWQPENLEMIDFMKNQHFVLAANFHGGDELVNYPWDIWTSSEKVHPDDLWYKEISHQYADTVHANSSGYMVGFDNGITNGGDWYIADGSRQDYMNYYLHGRETTIELSTVKMPDPASLPNYWNYNYRSLLNYINRVHTGVYGKITDQDGLPLHAKISLKAYDSDSSEVYSNALNGMYYRMLRDGSYRLTASLTGYSFFDSTVSISNHLPTRINIKLKKDPLAVQEANREFTKVIKYNNPVQNQLNIDMELEKPCVYYLELIDFSGKKILDRLFEGNAGINSIQLDVGNIKDGIYLCKIYSPFFIEKIKFVKIK